MLDQVEQRLLGPVDVVEDRDERTFAGELLEQASRRCEHLVARAVEHALVTPRVPERLANRRERRALAVGRAARDDSARLAVERAEQLLRQSRLADAGVADDRHQAGARRGGLAVGGTEPFELLLLPDKRRVVAARDRRRAGIDGLEPERDRLLVLPLQGQRIELRRAHGMLHQAVRRLAEDDLAGSGRLLEPLADGDGVAADEAVPSGRIPGHDLAGVDPDPRLEVHVAVAVELGDALVHGDGRAHRAQRVILVHHRHAEDGHDLVADELLHGAAVCLDRRGGALEEDEHQVPQRLRVEPAGQLGVRHEVAEEDGDRLAAFDRASGEHVHVPKVHPSPSDFEAGKRSTERGRPRPPSRLRRAGRFSRR